MIINNLVTYFLFSSAHAHVVGTDGWCLATSPVHFECFYLDRATCIEKLNNTKKALREEADGFQCAPYPIDFRYIPKTGELAPESKVTGVTEVTEVTGVTEVTEVIVAPKANEKPKLNSKKSELKSELKSNSAKDSWENSKRKPKEEFDSKTKQKGGGD